MLENVEFFHEGKRWVEFLVTKGNGLHNSSGGDDLEIFLDVRRLIHITLCLSLASTISDSIVTTTKF